MDMLNEYIKRNYIIFASMIYSFVSAILCFVFKLLSINTLIIIFLCFLCSVLLSTITIYYMIVKERDYMILGYSLFYIISVVVLAVSFFTGSVDIYMYEMFGVFIYSLALVFIIRNKIKMKRLLKNKKKDEIAGYDGNTGEPIYKKDIIGFDPDTGEPVLKKKKNVRDLLKNRKIIIIACSIVCLLFVSIGGYFIYDTFFSKTTILLLDNFKVDFEGYDGMGYVNYYEIGDIEYDKNNADVVKFVESITVEYNCDDFELKNGEEVEFNAVYDKEEAKRLKLDVKNTSVTVEVDGLTIRFTDASEVPGDISRVIKKEMDYAVDEEYDNESSYRTYSKSFKKMYFVYDEVSFTDFCVGVYEVTETNTYGGTPVTETYFIYTYIDLVNEDYDVDGEHVVEVRTLFDDNRQNITDQDDVLDALEDIYLFEDHVFSEMN